MCIDIVCRVKSLKLFSFAYSSLTRDSFNFKS